MNREVKKILVVIGLIGSLIFLFQNIDLARAKDADYPTKPIEFYISMTAGGTSDTVTRALLNAASKHLGQPFVPINKLGGSGAIAIMTVRLAKPDGYTLGLHGPSTAFILPLSEGAPFKDIADYTWIMNFGTYVWPLIVRDDAPWKTFKEFIEWAKKNPRAAKIGITAAKTADCKGLVMWQIEQREKVEFTYLPFRGSPEVLSAILGGHINVWSSTLDIPMVSYIKEGKFRILAYLGQKKIPGYEDIPSTEQLYGLKCGDLLAIYGPKDLPNFVLRKLENAFTKAVKDPDFVRVMNLMYMPIMFMDSATLTKYANETFLNTSKIYEKVKAEEAKEKERK